MKPFTTSAQKTLPLSVENILQTLEKNLEKTEDVAFKQTDNPNILKAKMKDGSTLAIAGFKKENGKNLAMIDHENVPGNVLRSVIQKKWKDKLAKLFA